MGALPGTLRLKSERTPFRRAGLAWGAEDTIEVDIRDLDGERLLAVLREPVLTIDLMEPSGEWKRLGKAERAHSAEQLQSIIDQAKANMPEPPPPLPSAEQLAADLAAARTRELQLSDVNDELRADLQSWVERGSKAEAEVHELKDEIAQLRQAIKAKPKTPEKPKPALAPQADA
jgi:hypothetical protein